MIRSFAGSARYCIGAVVPVISSGLTKLSKESTRHL
jgi:hypothetical protein